MIKSFWAIYQMFICCFLRTLCICFDSKEKIKYNFFALTTHKQMKNIVGINTHKTCSIITTIEPITVIIRILLFLFILFTLFFLSFCCLLLLYSGFYTLRECNFTVHCIHRSCIFLATRMHVWMFSWKKYK